MDQRRLCLVIAASLFGLAALGAGRALAQELDAQGLYAKAYNAVVLIEGAKTTEAGSGKAFGSGFFVDKDVVATAWHVVDRLRNIRIKLDKDKYVGASLMRSDKDNDVALLRVAAPDKSPLPIASGHPRTGDSVVVVGSPLGLEKTLSTGLVSAVRFDEKEKRFVYQISAPVSPGSSGGPVLNGKGEVLGVVSYQAVKGQNLNFIRPAMYLSKLMGKSVDEGTGQASGGGMLRMEKDAGGGLRIMNR